MREAIRVLQQTRVLEPAATRLAVQRMTPAKLDIIRAAYERQNEQNEQTRIEDLVQCDLEFHAAITRASDNDTLHSILDGLSNKTVRLRIWGGIVSDNAAGLTIDHHRLILKAITDGDPHLAEAAALVHMTHARGWLDAYLDDRPPHPVRPQGQRTRRPASAALSRGANMMDWWRWGRVELPVQDPSSETTTSVSDGLSSTARTGIGTLPDGPVTCP